MLYCSNGGGGFGPPHERAIELVLSDLRAGGIDQPTAANVYGVVLRHDGGVDESATAARREQLARVEPEMGLGHGQVHPVGARVRLIPAPTSAISRAET